MFQSASVVVVPNMPIIIIFPVNGNMWPFRHAGGCHGDWTREEAVPVINKILTQDQLHALAHQTFPIPAANSSMLTRVQ